MKDSKRFRILLISLLTMLLAMSCTVFTAIATTEFKMIDGASIRVAQTADGYYGIRFGAQIADTEKNYKMLIIPEDYYDGYLSATDKNDRNVVEYLIDKFGESNLSIVQNCAIKDGVASGSILRVKYNNLNRGFLGVAYYETESEGNTVYNTAAFATERPNAYTIAEIAAENYDYYVEQGADEAVAGLKNIIFNALNQKNGISESDSANTTPVINVVEESKKVFVGEAFTLSYENAVASSLIKYTGENVSVDNGNITVNVAGTTTITADLLGLTDTVSVTAVSKNIANLKGTGKTITWDEVDGADKYIITVNGTEYETATNSYTLTTGGVYNISVCAVVGEAKGNAATLNDYLTTTDDIQFYLASDISFDEATYTSGTITMTHTPGEFVNSNGKRSSATILLNKAYEVGNYIKVGFISNSTKLQDAKLGISFLGNSTSTQYDNINPGRHSFVFDDIANGMYLNYGGNTVTDYTIAWGGSGLHWNNTVDIEAGLNPNNTNNVKYYIVVGTEQLLDGNKLITAALLDKDNNVIQATTWNETDVIARNGAFAKLPESGNFAIHYYGESTVTLDYTVGSKTDMFNETELTAPAITVNGNVAEWLSPLADKYLVSIDDGEYEETTETSKMFNEEGIFNVKVKAVYGNTVSSIGEAAVSTLTDWGFANIKQGELSKNGNVTSITFTPTDDITTTGGQSQKTAVIYEKQNYSTQFIKLGFTAVSNNLQNNFINIAMRTDKVGDNPVFGGRYNLFLYDNGSNFYAGFGINNKYEYGNAPTKYGTYTTDLRTGIEVPAKYYIVFGELNGTVHFALYKEISAGVEEIVCNKTWNLASRESATGVELPDSGYFVISSWLGQERTLTYEVIDETQLPIAVTNASSYQTTVNANGGYDINFTTPSTNVNQGNNTGEFPGKSTNFTTLTKYDDEFIKVGFTSTSVNLADEDINISLRTTTDSTWVSGYNQPWRWYLSTIASGGKLMLGVHGGGKESATFALHGSYADNANYLLDGMEVGAKYYYIAGVVNDNDIYVMLYKETATGDELVASASWDFKTQFIDANVMVNSSSASSIGTEGYYVVSCWQASVTRTITVDILTATEANTLISAIPSTAE